jgi:hypothetical protein
MPSTSPRSSRALADHEATTDNVAYMLRTADGHRAYPRYPDGIEFDLKGDDDGCQASKHVSEIRNPRDDFGCD